MVYCSVNRLIKFQILHVLLCFIPSLWFSLASQYVFPSSVAPRVAACLHIYICGLVKVLPLFGHASSIMEHVLSSHSHVFTITEIHCAMQILLFTFQQRGDGASLREELPAGNKAEIFCRARSIWFYLYPWMNYKVLCLVHFHPFYPHKTLKWSICTFNTVNAFCWKITETQLGPKTVKGESLSGPSLISAFRQEQKMILISYCQLWSFGANLLSPLLPHPRSPRNRV